MKRIFQIKILWLGLLLASSSLAAQSAAEPPSKTNDQKRMQMPVEVVGTGGKREWVMVEVSNEAIPEPGAATLLAMSSLLLLLRRRRVK